MEKKEVDYSKDIQITNPKTNEKIIGEWSGVWSNCWIYG